MGDQSLLPIAPPGGNSTPVFSAQTGPHPDLEKLVLRHRAHPFRKPFAPYNERAFAEAEAAWQRVGRTRPLILDSCCGVGWSTVHLARRYPEHFVLGVDRSEDRLNREIKGVAGGWPKNLAFVRADLVDFWRLMGQAAWRPSHHYLLYPNPSPKVGDLAKRWHAHAVFPALLRLGGYFECRSNWRIYIEEMALALGWSGYCGVQVEPWSASPAITPFERKYQESGHELWRCRVELS